MGLHINQVTKQFPKNNGPPVTVLNKIEIRIHDGEFVSLLGHSGCGKSTLLSILAWLIPATSGTVWLEGSRVIDPSSDIVEMLHEAVLFTWSNVQENVAFSLR